MTGKPLDIDQEWCLKAAHREAESGGECGAGLLARDPILTEQDPLKEVREILRSCYQVADRSGVQTRWPELTKRIGEGIDIINHIIKHAYPVVTHKR